MMFHKKAPAKSAALGDEVWAAEDDSTSECDGSDVDSELDIDSDTQTTTRYASPSQPACQSGSEPVPSRHAATMPHPGVKSSTGVEGKPVDNVRGGESVLRAERGPSVMGSPPVPKEGGLMGLVTHLRGDNTRLREALLKAQHDLEILAENQASQDTHASVDFAHLLSLVKDFGDDLGSFQAQDESSVNNQSEHLDVFQISSPRSSEDGSEEAPSRSINDEEKFNSEAQDLRLQLQEARAEVSDLRAQLALKDAELFKLRGDSAISESVA